jgi:pilus assembly protein Flp/PilA
MVRLLQAWLWLREKGQGLVEYALILVLIAVVVIAILTVLGTQVSTVFSSIASALNRGS